MKKIKFKINDKKYSVNREILESVIVKNVMSRLEEIQEAKNPLIKQMIKSGVQMAFSFGNIKKPEEFSDLSDLEFLVMNSISSTLDSLEKNEIQLTAEEEE